MQGGVKVSVPDRLESLFVGDEGECGCLSQVERRGIETPDVLADMFAEMRRRSLYPSRLRGIARPAHAAAAPFAALLLAMPC